MALGVAFIGYGGMAGWHHKSIREKVPGMRVIGAFDIRQEALDKAKGQGIRASREPGRGAGRS